MESHLYSQMHTRLLKVKIHTALLTCISMLCSPFNRCLLWAQHHWMHLKGTTGIYMQKTDQVFFQNSLSSSSSMLTVVSLASQLSHSVNSVTLFPKWEPPRSFFFAVCQLSGEPASQTNSFLSFFFFSFFQKTTQKIPFSFSTILN